MTLAVGGTLNPNQSINQFQEVGCLRCAELQTVKDELREELLLFKAKADELEGKVDEVKHDSPHSL